MIKKKLEEYLDYKQPQPYIVSNEQYSNEYKTPVLTAGKSFLLGMTNDTKGIYPASKDEPIILFDDFTTDIKWVDFPFKVKSSACKILVPRNDTNLRFCYYGMKSLNFDASQHKRYWISQYSQMQLPDYPNARKAKIVERLSRIENQINIKENQLNKLDSLVKSRFIEMFGDPMMVQSNCVFTDCVKFNPKKSETKGLGDIDVSFVPMECVGTDGSFSIKRTGKISEFYKGYTYFKDGDVLIAKITPCFENGKAAIAVDCTNGIGFGTTEFHVARPISGKSNAYWIVNLLRNDNLHDYAATKMSGSAGQKRIQTPFFEKLKVYLPPIELQNQFADFVKLVDKSRFVVHSRYFLWLNFTFVSSTIAYSRVVSILECPKRC